MIAIDAETVHGLMDWHRVVEALRDGHRGPRPSIDDLLMRNEGSAFLIRASWVPGGAVGLKAVTVFPGNPNREPPLPAVQGQFLLFDGDTGAVTAAIDGAAITALKTAGDSALGSDLLSRRDVETLAMVGAGAMAEPLIRAHLSVRPSLRRIVIANRTVGRAEALKERLADTGCEIKTTASIDTAVAAGDVVSVATMTREPIIRGELLRPGAHLDLVGAYTPDMREADDEVFRRGRLFVDARETTVHEIGELMIPLAAGVISEDDIQGDLFEMVPGSAGRASPEEVTVYKNGGGAHLDLMTAGAIHHAWLQQHTL
ncbi:ornithine cyclodeaminase [Microbaculum marinum]|uniref:Ornithine cyclodeaminase n=1 Tax=Microbaculum marinum TaxID=1764581 RepID=A0AAW9RW53_9HYPH